MRGTVVSGRNFASAGAITPSRCRFSLIPVYGYDEEQR